MRRCLAATAILQPPGGLANQAVKPIFGGPDFPPQGAGETEQAAAEQQRRRGQWDRSDCSHPNRRSVLGKALNMGGHNKASCSSTWKRQEVEIFHAKILTVALKRYDKVWPLPRTLLPLYWNFPSKYPSPSAFNAPIIELVVGASNVLEVPATALTLENTSWLGLIVPWAKLKYNESSLLPAPA